MELIKDRFYVTRCMDIVRVIRVVGDGSAEVVVVRANSNRAGFIYSVYPDGSYYGASEVSDRDLLSMTASQEMDAADGEPVTANEIYDYLKSKGVPAGLEVGVVQVKGENPSILTLVFQGRKVTLRPQLRNFWVAISNFIHKEVLQKVEPVERVTIDATSDELKAVILSVLKEEFKSETLTTVLAGRIVEEIKNKVATND